MAPCAESGGTDLRIFEDSDLRSEVRHSSNDTSPCIARACKYTRKDSNLQPPVPKKGAGTLPNATEGLVGTEDTSIGWIRKTLRRNAGFCVPS